MIGNYGNVLGEPFRNRNSDQQTEHSSRKRFLSATQLTMFLRCPRQYEYRYIQGIKRPPSGAMVQGRVWHETLERNYRQKVDSNKDLPLSEMQESYADRLDETLASEEIEFEPTENPAKLKDVGSAIVAAHHKSIAPIVHPMAVEQRFTVDFGPAVPFDFVGVWDLIERDGTIVVETSLSEFLRAPAFSRLKPKTAINSCLAWSVKYRIPILFACDRRHGNALTYQLLEKCWRYLGADADAEPK